jgi:integrase
MSLTSIEIEKALKKPTTKRYQMNDGHGLSLDILPSGVRSWVFRYRLDGKQERVKLGDYKTLSLAEARKQRDARANLVNNGTSPAQEKKRKRVESLTVGLTLSTFGDRYFAEQVKPNLKDPSEVRRYLNKEIYPHLGDRLLKDITAVDVRELIYDKRDKGRVVTALRMRQVLKGLYDYAMEKDLVIANPATQCATKYIGQTKKRTRKLSPTEIRIVLRTLDDSDIRESFKLALRITLLTLTRKSELRLAEWKDVNFEAGEWFVPGANTKTGVDHTIYLSNQVAEMFRELQVLACGSPYVLPGKSSIHRPMHENTLNGVLDRISFDVPAFVIHDFRRTASTILHNNGFAPDWIELSLGHQIPGMRGVYNTAQYATDRKRMLAWWADYIDGLVSGSNVVIGNFGA